MVGADVLQVESVDVPSEKEQEHTATSPAAEEPSKPEILPLVSRGAYSLREEHLQGQEADGVIEFRYITNDGSDQNNIW